MTSWGEGASRAALCTNTAAAAIPPFQSFLEEHRTVVYRFLLAQVGPNDADDCFQEAFLAALRAYPTLRDASNLRGWILTIATRKALDSGRRRQRRAIPVDDVAAAASTVGYELLCAVAPRVPFVTTHVGKIDIEI